MILEIVTEKMKYINAIQLVGPEDWFKTASSRKITCISIFLYWIIEKLKSFDNIKSLRLAIIWSSDKSDTDLDHFPDI